MRSTSARSRSTKKRRPLRLCLEDLEDRTAPALITVTTASDGFSVTGPVSLREAITAINAGSDSGFSNITSQNPGTFGQGDTIDFNIPGTGVQTIALTAGLPPIEKPMTIDGYSQPGASPNTLADGDNAVLLIDLNGSAAGNQIVGLGINSGSTTVDGLAINGFSGIGIAVIVKGGDVITGNFIGTNPAGTAADANQADGILVSDGSNDNTIGGTTPAARNLISANDQRGVQIYGSHGSTGNVVEGNFIGTNAAGTAAIANQDEGVLVNGAATKNTVGGTTAATANIISGNARAGVWLADAGTSGNVVEGDFIGTNAAATAAIPNQGDGVLVSNGAANDNIGGIIAGVGNTIANNNGSGVYVSDSGTTGITVRGNAVFGNNGNDQGVDLVNGANHSQAAPFVTGATLGASTSIRGTLTSTARTTFTLDFYAYNGSTPLGETYLGSTSVRTDANGKATFSATFGTTTPGQWIVATATDPAGDTSADSFFNPNVTEAASDQNSGGAANQYSPAADNVRWLGGPVIPNVEIEPIFISDPVQGTSVPASFQTQIMAYYSAITTSSFIPDQLAQYSIPGLSIGSGGVGTADTVSVAPATTTNGRMGVTVPAYNAYNDGVSGDPQIQGIIEAEIAAGHTAQPTADTYYAIFTPPGDAVVDAKGSNSVFNFGAYHNSFYDSATQSEVYYQVIPDEEAPGPNDDFTEAYAIHEEEEATTHETLEGIADPLPNTGWTNGIFGDKGEYEIADQAYPDHYEWNGYQVQYIWSNLLTGPGNAPGTSGNLNQLFINQLSPPAVYSSEEGLIPVGTFTDPGILNAPSDFLAQVQLNNGPDWTDTITGGAGGVYVVYASPPSTLNGPYGTFDAGELGGNVGFRLEVQNVAGGVDPDSGAPFTVEVTPFSVSSSPAPMIYNADSNGMAHDFTLDQNSGTGNYELWDNGQLVFVQPMDLTTAIDITAAPGADSSLTIDYSGGTIGVPIAFDGGSGSGAHTLVFENGYYQSETYTPSGPGTGTIALDSCTIKFAEVSTVVDLATGTNVTLAGTNATNVQLALGPIVHSAQTYQISSESSGFAPLDFANMLNVTLDDEGGADEFDVQATPAYATTTINGGAGTNVVKVGSLAPSSGGVLSNILGALVIENETATASGTTTVTIDDSGDGSAGANATVDTTVTGGEAFGVLGGLGTAATISWDISDRNSHNDVNSVTIDGGSSDNAITIVAATTLASAYSLTLNASGDPDVTVNPLAPGTNLTVDTASTLTYAGDGTNNPSGADSGDITQPGAATVTYAGVGTVNTHQVSNIHLVVTVQPLLSFTAGSHFTVYVAAEDASGNVDTGFTGYVTLELASNPHGSTLGGDAGIYAVNGVATFRHLTLNKAGSGYVLQAVADGLPIVDTTSFTVTPAAATHLVVVSQPPAKATTGASIGLVVAAEDPFGNVASSFNGIVTIALAKKPTGERACQPPCRDGEQWLRCPGRPDAEHAWQRIHPPGYQPVVDRRDDK